MKKAIIYVRVSSKEQKQEGYSIPAQKRLLREYARANGFKVVREFEDNETAKQAGRSGFGKMIEYLKHSKSVQAILVEKTDRLYRNFKDYVTIDELKVTVFLVKENEKIGEDASSHQKFMHGIKVLMAKNFIDNLSEETRKGLKQKADSGIYPCSRVPLGYKLEKKDGKIMPVIDEENKEIVMRIFEYYATGLYSLDSLIQKIKEEGLFITSSLTKGMVAKKLTRSVVQRILRNPFYCGEFLWNGKLYKGIHAPLINNDIWDKAQEQLDRHRRGELSSKYNVIQFTFKGLFTCGECGRTITAERKIKPSGKEYVYYRCTKFGTQCSQKPVNEKNIDKQIIEILGNLEVPQNAISYITEGLKQSLYLKRDTEDKIREKSEMEKRKLQKRLDALYEDKLDNNISQEFYDYKFEEYSNRVEELDDKISRYTKADLGYYDLGSKVLELAKNAYSLYKKANSEEKRELLGFLLSDSVIKDGKVLVSYKKPFNKIYQRAQCSDWGGYRDLNPR